MAPPIDLVLGIHCHQPVGNFPDVIDDAFHRAYRPFIDALANHPRIKAVAHYTGPLWEFFEQRHPAFIDRLRTLVDRGQLELLGGGHYEPILAVLPERDALGQLNMLSDYLEDRFGERPRGMWLGERVWEPHLPSLLATAGLEYTALDDFHFQRAGLNAEELYGRFLTEDQGYSLGVFPISGMLRYLVPFRPVDEVMDFLQRAAASHDGPLLTLLDDGEKFGVWPGTYEWVYEQGWLDRFLSTLEDHVDWIRTRTLSEAFDERPALGTVYLPTSSYFELTEWALPVDAGRAMNELTERLGEAAERYRFLLAGGTWRNFLTKYPEVNHLHKRMMMSSQRFHRLCEVNPDQPELHRARDALYRAQCNDAYWHGLFGGAYLPHLRDGVYRQLIEAEVQMDAAEPESSSGETRVEEADVDLDGQTEAIVASERWWACVQPQGGLLTELDDKPRRFNVLNTFARREELYHQDVVDAARPTDGDRGSPEDGAVSIHEIQAAKQPDLDQYLIYDRRRRAALHDLFLAPETTLDDLVRSPDAPLADWSTAQYDVESEVIDGTARVTAARRGPVGPGRLDLVKTLRFTDDDIEVHVQLANVSETPWEGVYGLEVNLALLAGDAPDRYVRVNDEHSDPPYFAGRGRHTDVRSLGFVNEYAGFQIELDFHDPAEIWRHPIQTVNNSEAGFEFVYQATAVVMRWPLSLAPGASLSRRWTYRVRSL